MHSERIFQKLKDLPDSPGVYIMKNAVGVVIYVGKAKVLKNRVRQYFHYTKTGDKVEAMVSHIDDFEYILTHTEIDALMLEANLIKRYRPQYNILLKDDKNFPYLRINLKEKYPKFTIVRKLKNDGAKYFGPYMGMSLKELLELIHSAYPLRVCNRNFDKPAKKARACLNFHLGRCQAPCENRVSEEDYRIWVEKAMAFLNGQEEQLEQVLLQKMTACAEAEEYESAILFRDRINMVKKIKLKKITALEKSVSMDVFAIVSNGTAAAVSMLYIREGKMTGARNYTLSDASLQSSDTFRNFLMQFYTDKLSISPEVILSELLPDMQALEEVLNGISVRKVKLLCPRQGIKRQLAVMAENNAREFLTKSIERINRKEELTFGSLELLKTYLNLEKLPRRIECYDISNISGTDKTASMAVMTDGESDSKEYRRFRIKTVEGSDDFASLNETLRRRFERARQGDLGFSSLPDLLVIDGGKGQLSSAYEAMRETGFDIPMISLAKRDEEIYSVGVDQPLKLPKSNLALRLLQRVRDEAHRFAVAYHRTLRNTRFESELKEIEGIGSKKRAALLKKFKSLEGVKRATEKELCETEGISTKLAQIIREHFSAKTEEKI